VEKWENPFVCKGFGLHTGVWKNFLFSTTAKKQKNLSTYHNSHFHKIRWKSTVYSYWALMFALMSLMISVRSASFFMRSSTRLMA